MPLITLYSLHKYIIGFLQPNKLRSPSFAGNGNDCPSELAGLQPDSSNLLRKSFSLSISPAPHTVFCLCVVRSGECVAKKRSHTTTHWPAFCGLNAYLQFFVRILNVEYYHNNNAGCFARSMTILIMRIWML